QKAEPRREMRIIVHRIAQQVLHPGVQLVVPGRSERKDGPLRPLALAGSPLGGDEAPLYQKLDHGIERAVPNFDALALVTLLQGSGHLVRMHRPLEQQRQHRQSKRIGGVSECGHLAEKSTGTYNRPRIYVAGAYHARGILFCGKRATSAAAARPSRAHRQSAKVPAFLQNEASGHEYLPQAFAPLPRIRSKTEGDPAAGSCDPPNFSQPGHGIRPDLHRVDRHRFITTALSKASLSNCNLSAEPRRRSMRALSR